MYSQWYAETLVGGGVTNWPTTVTKLLLNKKVTEYTVGNPLATWLTFDQLSCKFENIGGGHDAPSTPASAHLCAK